MSKSSRNMRRLEWLWMALIVLTVWRWGGCRASPAPMCHLYNAHDCLTQRRGNKSKAGTAYVKRCCPRGSLLVNTTCVASNAAANVPTPQVRQVEGVWEEEPVHCTCQDQDGSRLVQTTLDLSTFLSADENNVVQLEVAGSVTRDYCVGVVSAGGEDGGHPEWQAAGLLQEPSDHRVTRAPSDVTSRRQEAKLYQVALFCTVDPVAQRSRDRKLCEKRPCVRKCCPPGKFLKSSPDNNADKCIYTRADGDHWTAHNSSFGRDVPSNISVIYNLPYNRVCYVLHEFVLLPNGNLEIEGSFQLSPDDYCVDVEMTRTGLRREGAWVCPDPCVCWWKNEVQDVLLLSVSCVFLLLTVVAYVGTPVLRGTNSSRCLVALVLSRLLASLINIVTNFSRSYLTSQSHLCTAVAFVNLAFILSTFFWLNVTCFDIWFTITCKQNGRRDSLKTFALYWTYAWVCPLLLAGLALALDAIPEGLQIWPVFAEAACWFISHQTRWAYKHSVILILLLVNLGFFVHVFYTLHKQLNNKDLNNDTSRTTGNKTLKWKMFCNLFILMGMVWIIQIPLPGTSSEVCVWWRVILDAITDLQGVAIFVVTVCNEDKRKKVREGPIGSMWCFIWRPPTKPVSSGTHTVALHTVNHIPSFRERYRNNSDTHFQERLSSPQGSPNESSSSHSFA
ncbi:probable G-protein coupled receptor Mth-like 3 isoform X2 [Panulirus ornatus]|uniref:probable G-protein coupled receptor Mth-like 3 isoform X2 n=1 Tax=Panulirus ornatus TaxID=150431 RepID=UPI003A85F8F3